MCDNLIKEIVGDVGSRMVDVYIKGVNAGMGAVCFLGISPGRGNLSKIKASNAMPF